MPSDHRLSISLTGRVFSRPTFHTVRILSAGGFLIYAIQFFLLCA